MESGLEGALVVPGARKKHVVLDVGVHVRGQGVFQGPVGVQEAGEGILAQPAVLGLEELVVPGLGQGDGIALFVLDRIELQIGVIEGVENLARPVRHQSGASQQGLLVGGQRVFARPVDVMEEVFVEFQLRFFGHEFGQAVGLDGQHF